MFVALDENRGTMQVALVAVGYVLPEGAKQIELDSVEVGDAGGLILITAVQIACYILESLAVG